MTICECKKCGVKFETAKRFTWYCPACYKVVRREQGRKCDAKRHFVSKCIDCGKPVGRKSSKGQGRCLSCRFKGKRNVFWKGGRYKGFHGYVYIYIPEHPRAKYYHNRYVAEHILVWEKSHNQPLPEGYLIHHLNGIKDDNRPENLAALLPKDHSTGTLRELLQKRIRELEQQPEPARVNR